MKKENKKSHSWKSCTIIKPAEEEGVLLSFFFAQDRAKGTGPLPGFN